MNRFLTLFNNGQKKGNKMDIRGKIDYSNLHPFRDFFYMYDGINKQWIIADSDDIFSASVFFFSENYYRIDEAIDYFYEQKKQTANKNLFQFKAGDGKTFFTTAWIYNMIPICRWKMK